jgi:tetratricopeptide (TPR) repeat protein
MDLARLGQDPSAPYEASIADYDAALRLDPTRWEAWFGRGHVRTCLADYRRLHGLDASEQYEAAIPDLEEAVRLNPEGSPECWLHLGIARIHGARQDAGRSHQVRQGIRNIDEALKLDSSNYEAWRQRAGGYATLLLEARRAVPRDPVEIRRLYDAVERDFAEALRLNPSNAESLLKRAQHRLWAGEWQTALADFEACVAANPSLKPKVADWMAQCRLRLNPN